MLSFFVVFAFSDSVGALQSSRAAGLLDEFDEAPKELVSPQHPLAAGEIVVVDRALGTITIRRRPIPELFMTETMTMIFRVSDRSMLEGLTPGDRVRFKVERAGTSLVVVWIEHSN